MQARCDQTRLAASLTGQTEFRELRAPVSVVVINQNYNIAIQPTRGGFGDGRTNHDESSGPPITPVRKRPLQILSKMKRLLTAIAVLCIVASMAMAIPVQCLI